jgi:glycosyltransferase involved in cell wall biosynthesis
MNTNPQTLIVSMPVYNSEATLRLAIESVLNQSYKNLRLIIVDDNSTDRSLEIAKEYLRDSRVIILSNLENRGAYYCRNAGLSYVAGMTWGYFTTHDADDISFEHRYLKLIRVIKSPRICAVQDSFRRIDMPTGKIISEKVTLAHAIFTREIFDRAGYFETVRFGGDWEHWTRVGNLARTMGKRTATLKEILGESFIHGANLTSLIPENSRPRLLYMKQVKKRMQIRIAMGNLYQDFELEDITQRVYR